MKEFLNMGSTTNLQTNKTLFIPCGCRNEILMIEYDHEFKIADVCIYENPSLYKYKMPLVQRLRYAWQILFYKKPYADQIVLDIEQIKELRSFLDIILD